MKNESVHDRPMGLFILAGFVVLGVIVQITVLPPKASADARRTEERVSFSELEPIVISEEPVQVVPVPDALDEVVETPAWGEMINVPAVREPEASLGPIEAQRVLVVEPLEVNDPVRPELIDDVEPDVIEPIEVPLVPEPEEEPAADRQGYQVMGSVLELPANTEGDSLDTDFPEEPHEVAPEDKNYLYQDDTTLDDESLGTQLVLLGPSVSRAGEEFRYTITAENVEDLLHAPLRLSFDPQVLEFVEADEGDLLRLDGAPTLFMASEGAEPGQVSIALSRMPPAEGANGSGVLCTVTFRGIAPGQSPIVLGGSRLLDEQTHDIDHERTDSNVAIE